MRRARLPRYVLNVLVPLLLSCFLSAASFATTDLSITGKVTDTTGKPIPRAIVMVYHAGPRSGYGVFCPTCYPDCGKRAITDSSGTFAINHLHPDLWFELFVEKGGYEPKFLGKVVPTPDAHVTTTLIRQQSVSEPNLLFRGHLVDTHGLALRDAVVHPIAAMLPGGSILYTFGVMAQGVDPIAITNADGNFEIAYRHPAQDSTSSLAPSIPEPPLKILVSVEARGMAQAFHVIPAGSQRHTITVRDGGTIRGRLIQNGQPVGGAEMALTGDPIGGWGANFQPVGNPYGEITVGTQPDGTFAIPDVPFPWHWYIYAKAESVASRGATGNIKCATKRDDEIVDLGDLQLKPAYHLRGKVSLSDGSPIPHGITVTISSDIVRDAQKVTVPPNGQFQFAGLAAGNYDVSASVKGYSPPHSPAPVSVEHDVDNYVITLRASASPHAKAAPTTKH